MALRRLALLLLLRSLPLSPLLLLLPLLAAVSATRVYGAPGYATVLLYHRFDEPRYPTTNTQVQQFRAQLAHLRSEGYRFLSVAEFAAQLSSGTPFLPRSVMITIDDAHCSIFTGAFPVLREAGVPFVVFVNVSAVSAGPAHMTWDMLAEMTASGAVIGNHSFYHPHIGQPLAGQDSTSYRIWVEDDLRRAQAALRSRGFDSALLAFPFGEYNDTVVAAARGLGYRLLFTQDEGAVDQHTTPWLIPRVAMVGANMDMERFAYKLGLSPLQVDDVRPAGGFLDRNPPVEFALRLREPGRYRPGVINMFVSEWGRVAAEFDPRTGWLRFAPQQALTRPCNRVIVTARERDSGHYSMFSRLHVRPLSELAEE